jgi:hypothetical protein
VAFPGLYSARCETGGGATWLQVTKANSASDKRPVVTEEDGPDCGYHTDDVNLALGKLAADVASAESSWKTARRLADFREPSGPAHRRCALPSRYRRERKMTTNASRRSTPRYATATPMRR